MRKPPDKTETAALVRGTAASKTDLARSTNKDNPFRRRSQARITAEAAWLLVTSPSRPLATEGRI